MAASYGTNFDELYGYDSINRLVDMDRGDLNAQKDAVSSATFGQCWTLDATGNWRGFRQDDDGDGTWDLIQIRTSNLVNEIADITETCGSVWITPQHDRAGHMTRVPKPADPTQYHTCTYDAWNRLVKVNEGVTPLASYAYDGAKRLTVRKTYSNGSPQEVRHFYYSAPHRWQVLEERIGETITVERQFIWGVRYIDDLLLRDRDTNSDGVLDERLYSMQDANWNVTAAATSDGTVEERFAYTPYGADVVLTPSFGGRSLSDYDWETRFAGYRLDLRCGFFHVRNRVLVSNLGWLQRDAIMQVDHVNLFEYAYTNPLTFVDPTGNIPWHVIVPLLLGCVAGASVNLIAQYLLGNVIGVPGVVPVGINTSTLCNALTGCVFGVCLMAGWPLAPTPWSFLAWSLFCGSVTRVFVCGPCRWWFGCPLAIPISPSPTC